MTLSHFDEKLFYSINQLPHPFWADRLSLVFDCWGSVKILLGAAFIFAGLMFLVGWVKKKKEIWHGAILLAVSIVTAATVTFFLKYWAGRPRPGAVLSGVYLIGGHATEGSFPSGHAVIFGVVGAFMIFYFKKWRFFWASLVILSGFTRVYQGLHYPGDVIAGWAIAALVAWIASLRQFKT